jgi:hypothetical protein
MKKLAPTALVFVTLATYSQSSRKPRIVGVSFFPLFVDAVEGTPMVTDTPSQSDMISPHQGAFQMAIYHHKFMKFATPFTYESFIY